MPDGIHRNEPRAGFIASPRLFCVFGIVAIAAGGD
jgi:hypothetical protein